MTTKQEPLPSQEDVQANTSLSSSSGTTGLSSFNIIHGSIELDREEGRDDEKPESGVDQGDPSPRALHASGGSSPHTGGM